MNITYHGIIQETRKARAEGIDIIYLDEDEYEQTERCLLRHLKDQLAYTSECAALPKDVFTFMGIEFVKQA